MCINIHEVGDLLHLKDDVGFTGVVDSSRDDACETSGKNDFEEEGMRESSDAPPIQMTKGMDEPKLLVGDTSGISGISKFKNLSDTFAFQLVIDVEGSVQEVNALRSTGIADEVIVDELKKWRYQPAQRNGKAISIYWIEILRIKDGSVKRLRKQ